MAAASDDLNFELYKQDGYKQHFNDVSGSAVLRNQESLIKYGNRPVEAPIPSPTDNAPQSPKVLQASVSKGGFFGRAQPTSEKPNQLHPTSKFGSKKS
jgi:hypothetical protein